MTRDVTHQARDTPVNRVSACSSVWPMERINYVESTCIRAQLMQANSANLTNFISLQLVNAGEDKDSQSVELQRMQVLRVGQFSSDIPGGPPRSDDWREWRPFPVAVSYKAAKPIRRNVRNWPYWGGGVCNPSVPYHVRPPGLSRYSSLSFEVCAIIVRTFTPSYFSTFPYYLMSPSRDKTHH